jgi:ribosome-associated protein
MMDDEYEEGFEYAERPNKTQIKRELKVIHDLGVTLVDLDDTSLVALALSDNLLAEIKATQAMQKTALKRQLKRLAGLLREENVEQIQNDLERLKQPHRKEVETFHQLERWRDALLAGDKAVMDELFQQIPGFDGQYIRQLVRNANKEKAQNKPPKSARLLFQYLKDNQV